MASSLSEPAWCGPAGPGRSLPPSPSLVFFSGGVGCGRCDGGVGGGRRGNRRGDVAPLAPRSAARAPAVGGGCALGSGRGGGLVVLRGGRLGAGRGRVVGRSRRGCVRRRVSGGLLVSRAFGVPPGDARDPRDATAGLGQRSTASSARVGVVTSAAGAGARSESSGARTSGGGLAQAPAFLVVDTETTVWVTPPPPPLPGLDDSSSVSHASPGMAGVGTGTARRCLLGVEARAASSEGNCREVELDVQASRGAAFGFFKGGVVRVSVPAGLVESLGAVGRAIALRLGRHGGWRVMRATRFRGTSPPSPRDAVCGVWRRPLYYSAGFGTRAGLLVSATSILSFSPRRIAKVLARSEEIRKAPVASDIISTRSAT